MHLDAKSTVLVLIDLQKGVLAMPVAPHPTTEVYQRSMQLAQRFRAAGALLGPMVGGIVLGVNGVRLVVPRLPYLGAQAVVGAMVSAAITPDIVSIFSHDAMLFSVVLGVTVPGAAGPMMLLGEAEGADVHLVAFMQYSRVLLVVLAAAFVARFWADAADLHPHSALWLTPMHWRNLVTVLLLAALAQQAARLLRLPASAVLGPMLVLSALHGAGWLTIDLPRWLLAAAYAVLGWYIGLGFRRDALLQVGRALPSVLGATLALMALCALLALGPGALCPRRPPDGLPRHQPRRSRLHGHHRSLDAARGSILRTGLAIGAAAVRHRPCAADRAPRGPVFAASARTAALKNSCDPFHFSRRPSAVALRDRGVRRVQWHRSRDRVIC